MSDLDIFCAGWCLGFGSAALALIAGAYLGKSETRRKPVSRPPCVLTLAPEKQSGKK